MAVQIIDGTGTGSVGRVSPDNRMVVDAVIQSEEELIAERDALVFSATTGATVVTNAAGTYLYLKNTNALKTMVVEELEISCSGVCSLILRRNDTGTPGATTALVQANTNFSSSISADSDCFTTSGTAITGLTPGQALEAFDDLPVGRHVVALDGTFILGLNNVLTASTITSITGDLSVTVRYRFVTVL